MNNHTTMVFKYKDVFENEVSLEKVSRNEDGLMETEIDSLMSNFENFLNCCGFQPSTIKDAFRAYGEE